MSKFIDNEFRDYLESIGFFFQEEDNKPIHQRVTISKMANDKGWFWDINNQIWTDEKIEIKQENKYKLF